MFEPVKERKKTKERQTKTRFGRSSCGHHPSRVVYHSESAFLFCLSRVALFLFFLLVSDAAVAAGPGASAQHMLEMNEFLGASHIISSPLTRALQTAMVALREHPTVRRQTDE